VFDERVSFREFQQRYRFVLAALLKEHRERSLLREVLDVVEVALDLVHLLQLERGTSTRWLAASGKREATLATVVSRVIDQERTFRQVYEVYSEAIVGLIAILGRAGERCPLPVEGQQLLALHQFVVLKEKAGQERAIDAFLRHVDLPSRERWNSLSVHADFTAMERCRELVRRAQSHKDWPVADPAEWFQRASGRIDAMHRVEENLLSTLRTTVEQAEREWSQAFRDEGGELRAFPHFWLRNSGRTPPRPRAPWWGNGAGSSGKPTREASHSARRCSPSPRRFTRPWMVSIEPPQSPSSEPPPSGTSPE
jgi:hypothetical protein